MWPACPPPSPANRMSLVEILELNPKKVANPKFIRIGEKFRVA